MKALIDGIKRYEEVERPRLMNRFQELAGGQSPLALFITCADSRIVPNLVTSTEPGEIFIVRNIANMVPPATPEGKMSGGDSVAAAVWYAIEALKVRHIIVCGHSLCGGCKALLEPTPPPSAALQSWLENGKSSVEVFKKLGGYDPSLPPNDQLSQVNTRHQLDHLRTHDVVQKAVDAGSLFLHAWWFDIPKGQLLAYSDKESRYVPALEALQPMLEQVA